MPMFNILLRNYTNYENNNAVIAENRHFKVGALFIKRSRFLTGLQRALEKRTGILHTTESLYFPNEAILKDILDLKKEVGARAQKPIDSETPGLLFADFTAPYPFKIKNFTTSPVAFQAIIDIQQGKKCTTDDDYMAEVLRDIKLIILPFNIMGRIRVIEYVISLGLDIEVSMVSNKSTLQSEIEFINATRDLRKKKAKRPAKHEVVVDIKVPHYGLSSESAKTIRNSIVRCFKKEKGTEPTVKINWVKQPKDKEVKE